MKRPHPAVDLARLHAIEAATWPSRIDQALEQLDRALDPRRAGTGPGPVNGISDPTGTAVTNPEPTAIQARTDRSALLAYILRIDDAAREISHILGTWAPHAPKPIWCTNHQRHGRNEPRSSDGSRNCNWCNNVHRCYGHWPNGELVRLHAEGRRLNDGDMRRALGLERCKQEICPIHRP